MTGMAGKFPVRVAYNPDYKLGGMLSSIKTGLKVLGAQTRAALIALGDQPQVQGVTVRRIFTAFMETKAPLIIPSFENQRGHPWLAANSMWDEILALPLTITPRDFLIAHTAQVEYIATDNSVMQDLDTPEDYSRLRP